MSAAVVQEERSDDWQFFNDITLSFIFFLLLPYPHDRDVQIPVPPSSTYYEAVGWLVFSMREENQIAFLEQLLLCL